MRLGRLGMAAAIATIVAGPVLAQQQPSITTDGDDVKIRGCVTPVKAYPASVPPLLVWSRSDIMLSTAMGLDTPSIAATGPQGRVFYWLEDDEDLAKHVGQMVEVDGELKDFEKGEMEIKRDGAFTDVALKMGGKEEKIRVPSTWLGPGSNDDREFDIIGRRIEVNDVKVLGACSR